MKNPTFRFDPKLWLENRSLRTCSPAARGVWLDILCLCHASGGYLTLNGKPIDDNGLVSLLGIPLKTVRSCIAELGQAGIFSVTPDGLLYSSKMVKEAKFSEQAKVHGKVGNNWRNKRESYPHTDPDMKSGDIYTIEGMEGYGTVGGEWTNNPPETKLEKAIRNHGSVKINPKITVRKPRAPAPAPAPESVIVAKPAVKPKPLPWWKSPAGWVRKGQEQALSYNQGDDLEEFKYKVASRLAPGPHSESLTPMHRKMLEDSIENGKKEIENATKPMR